MSGRAGSVYGGNPIPRRKEAEVAVSVVHVDHRWHRRAAPHIAQRLSFAVAAKAPIDQFRAHGQSRGWRHARLLSAEPSSEMFLAPRAEPTHGPRHVDFMWPMWAILDCTPASRSEEREPSLARTRVTAADVYPSRRIGFASHPRCGKANPVGLTRCPGPTARRERERARQAQRTNPLPRGRERGELAHRGAR